MKQKQGYCITTYRFRLYHKHPEWFAQTKELYCRVAEFYLKLILDRNLSEMPDYGLQRAVEVVTQGEKSRNIAPDEPLPFSKIPLYFRRAALKEAASAARSWQTRKKSCKGVLPRPVGLDTSPVYYKGMYRKLDLPARRIELKLYTGTEWKWSAYRFSMDGRNIPEGAELLSPTIKIKKNQVYLHFPVKEVVEDVRTVKERKNENALFVSLQLGDVFAACVTEESGHIHMVRGGNQFRHRRVRLEQQLKQAGEAEKPKEIESIKEKLRNLMNEQAHKVSREIVDFAEKTSCRVIVVPDYQGNPGFNSKPYLKASDYDWIGRRIIEYVSYKSFQRGIVLCRIPVKGISSECSICGAKIKRYNEGHKSGTGYLGGRLYECPNGHKGNTAVNTARNVRKRYTEMM